MPFRPGSRATRDLPVVDAHPSDTAGGRAIRATLSRRGPFGVPVRLTRAAALEVPGAALAGPVGRSDVTVRPVTEASERIRLIVLADAAERNHPDPARRVASPRNHDLLEHGLWLVATDPAGTPLMLCVAPVDGDLATIRYIGALVGGVADADWVEATTRALLAELAVRGVRWLLDTERRTVGSTDVRVRHRRSRTGFALVVAPAFVDVGPYLERASALAVF